MKLLLSCKFCWTESSCHMPVMGHALVSSTQVLIIQRYLCRNLDQLIHLLLNTFACHSCRVDQLMDNKSSKHVQVRSLTTTAGLPNTQRKVQLLRPVRTLKRMFFQLGRWKAQKQCKASRNGKYRRHIT